MEKRANLLGDKYITTRTWIPKDQVMISNLFSSTEQIRTGHSHFLFRCLSSIFTESFQRLILSFWTMFLQSRTLFANWRNLISLPSKRYKRDPQKISNDYRNSNLLTITNPKTFSGNANSFGNSFRSFKDFDDRRSTS